MQTTTDTEIDWKTYMQQVQGVRNGTLDYAKLEGPTGPVVYPAGYIYTFLALYFLTDSGKNILLAQIYFAVLYLVTLVLVFRIYILSKKIPPYVLILMCCTSYRIHSIYSLRLFNDPLAIIALLAAINCYLSSRWTLGSIFFSFGVSIKMNILLFAPALWFILMANLGLYKAFKNIFICGFVQLLLALPFLISNPMAYMSQAFNLGRVFLYKWTVNWKFVPEEIFLSRYFHLALLLLHIITLLVFCTQWKRWLQLPSWLANTEGKHHNGNRHVVLGPDQLILPLFTANLIGITFSRSLHYQFYVWYYHSLPYLLWSTSLPVITKLSVLGLIELAWNTYPATIWSSAILHGCHLLILVMLYLRPITVWVQKPKEP